MKLYSIWQPLDSEDQRTAMVFGFLRHAPVEHGLSPWLSEVLGRPVIAEPLEPSDFWPGYTSHMPECTRTYPELVFRAVDDGGPLHVVVEAKPGSGMHDEEQLVREAVDTAHEEPASRIAVIAVGADPGPPTDLAAWRTAVDAGLAQYGPPGAVGTVDYSSWAQLGDAIEAAADAVPALALYAEDVLAQMRFNGMLGYKGAPVFDDLLEDGLTTANAFEVVNRAAVSARQFFRTLHDAEGFRAIGLGSYWGRFEMRRNGTSTSLNQDEEWFQLSMFLSAYRGPTWPTGAGAYAAFFFGSGEDPQLQVGAFKTTWENLLVEYDYSEGVDELTDEHLAGYAGPDLTIMASAANSEWLYDERPWHSGQQDGDIAWTIERLRAAASVFDRSP